MPAILKRTSLGLMIGGLTGGVLGALVGCGIASSDYLASPPQGEDYVFAMTMAAYTVMGPLVGGAAGLATGAINRRWVCIMASLLIGFISEYIFGYRTLNSALILAVIAAVTSVVVFLVIRPVS